MASARAGIKLRTREEDAGEDGEDVIDPERGGYRDVNSKVVPDGTEPKFGGVGQKKHKGALAAAERALRL